MWNQSEQQQSRYFNSGYGDAFVCCCCIPIWRRSPLEKRPLTDQFNAPPVMYASRIYVTGLVPCLVKAVDFLLYKLHTCFPSCSLQLFIQFVTPWNSIFKCISYAQTIKHNTYLDPSLGGFGRKPKRMCRAMITSFPTKFGQHPSISSVRKAMCSPTYTCISDPPPPNPSFA